MFPTQNNQPINFQGGLNLQPQGQPFQPNPTNPEGLKQMILGKYPNGIASDGRKYADIPASELARMIVDKFPDGVTNDGRRYSDFYQAGAEEAQPESVMSMIGEALFGPPLRAAARVGELGAYGAVQGFAKATGNEDLSQRATEALREPLGNVPVFGTSVGGVKEGVAGQKQVGGELGMAALYGAPITRAAGGIASAARFVGIGERAANLLGKIGSFGGVGYGFDVTSQLQQGETPSYKPGVGTYIGAAIPVAPKVAKAAFKGAGEALGLTTGTGFGSVKALFEASSKGGKAAQAATEALRGGTTPSEVVSEAKTALSQIYKARSENYKTALASLKSGKESYDISPIISSVKENLDNFLIRVGPDGTLDFSRSPIRFDSKAQNDVETIVRVMKDFGSQKGDRTVVGLDSLKRSFDDLYSDSSNVRAFIQSVKSATRDILSKAEGYDKMASDYENKSKVIKDITKTLSLGDQASIDTAFKKLTSVFRANNEEREILVRELDAISGGQLIPKIAGQQLSSVLPRGIARQVEGLGAFGALFAGLGPTVLKMALFASPRIVGEFVRALGLGNRAAQYLIESLGLKAAQFPGDYFLETKGGQAAVNYAKNVQPGLSMKNVAPKELEALAAEARKYKSAEEFVAAQQEVFHGSTSKEIQVPDPKMAIEQPNTVFFTDNQDLAHLYTFEREYGEIIGESKGKVVSGYLNLKNPKIIDYKGDVGDAIRMSKDIKAARAAGHDGIVFQNIDDGFAGEKMLGTSYAVFDKSSIMTKSQLTDFYNQVTGKSVDAFEGLSPKQNETLLAVHNTSASKLNTVKKLGGMANPSIAVFDPKKMNFENFGDITLVMPSKNLFSKGAKSFASDIYSPRFPSTSTKVDWKKLAEAEKKYGVDLHSVNTDDFLQSAERNGEVMRAFLKEKGVSNIPESEVAMKELIKPTEDEFFKFIDRLGEEIGVQEQIFKGFTPMGNRRYAPLTLENASKEMNKNPVQGGENFFYGLGSIRARLSKQIKSVAQFKKLQDRLLSPEEFTKVKEAYEADFREILGELDSYSKYKDKNGYIQYDRTGQNLGDYLAGDRAVLKEFFDSVPESLIKKIEGFREKLLQMPTEYFETKFKRPVDLSEFTHAFVPEGTNQETLNLLKGKNISIIEYPKGQQAKTVKDYVAENGMLFSASGAPVSLLYFGQNKDEPLSYRRPAEVDFTKFDGPITARGAVIDPKDIEEEVLPVLFGEVSNRPPEKQELELRVILNTIINRMKEYERHDGVPKTAAEVVAMANQYQAYGGKQYNLYKQGGAEADKAKIQRVQKIVEKLVKEIQNGTFKDNTNNAYYYVHNKDGSITYDDERPLFKGRGALRRLLDRLT